MAKSNIKNFVCSFVLSLLAVTAINKAAFRDPPATAKDNVNDADVKAQNISLFSKTDDRIDVLPTLVASEVDTSAIDALTASAPESSAVVTAEPLAEIPAASEIITADIPAPQESQADLALNSPVAEAAARVPSLPGPKAFEVSSLKPEINTDISAASEIVLEKENVITVAEAAPESYESKGIVYADISDTVADEKAAADELDKTVIYTPEDDKAISLNLVLKTPEENISVADQAQDISAPMPAEESEIPLEESEGYLHEKIDTMHAADASQIAMLEPAQLMSLLEEAPVSEEKTLAELDLKQNEWTQMSETVQEDSPWVVAKGNRFAKNRTVVEQFSNPEEEAADETTEATDDAVSTEENQSEDVSATRSEETLNETDTIMAQTQAQEIKDTLTLKPIADEDAETQVAYQMVPNLLIPIPEDIANDADLTPQLSIVPGEKPASQPASKTQDKNNKNKSDELNEEEKQSGLFKNITSWFSGKDKKEEKSEKKPKKPARQTLKKSGFSFFNDTEDDTSSETNDKIMPAELRLSFQPNRAEISGQTLRWIHAFADNARDNDDIYIEIRIDGTSSFALQQKRLNLLSTIFAGRGVDFRKINVVFTSREPNSFIIRNIRFNNQEEIVVNENSNNAYYRPW